MRALITGITGFAGGHLSKILLDQNDQVFGVDRREGKVEHAVTLIVADLGNPQVVTDLLAEVKPDAIYHLAAQAFVPTAWADPWETMENNIRPELNILQAMVKQKSTARLLVVASNEVYGQVKNNQLSVDEEVPLRPNNPYGVSKVAQDVLGLQYYLSHGLNVLRARAFNHIGPGQSPFFVTANFAKQIAQIEANLAQPIMHVGNLEAQRDFTDVYDVMRAYSLLVRYGQPGEAYNVGTGRPHSVQHILDLLLSYSKCTITIQPDPERLRPSDVPIIYADNRKLKATTGWEPTFSLEESLHRVLEYWREDVRQRL